MPVTLANVAFSCELFLKAILYGFGVDFSKTHGLKGLFEKLPQNEQEYISKNIGIENREKEFYLCLKEQDQAFPEYRYMCEAKAMSANPVFLFAFAHILKFVYESLVRENGKDEELR
ncbi:HEPN domain-containing protein [uncultured Acetatifactor sp.]|jgi:HEPN domain-containing protein|uniref:HEPN domain-containing protein n=1 Tax=uncultured Acetatifactor sp. TaxID=1671927 RepID=UPI00260C92EA|nr:HEPN domain-containing protein [uncultured Acetatifactor sp.]